MVKEKKNDRVYVIRSERNSVSALSKPISEIRRTSITETDTYLIMLIECVTAGTTLRYYIGRSDGINADLRETKRTIRLFIP